MLDLREAFFLPAGVELRAYTHGLQPKTVPEMLEHFADDWRNLGVDAWNEVPNHWLPDSGDPVGWWSLPEYLGDTFVAPLIGAPAGTCILQPNVHWIVQCLLSAPEIGKMGSTVVFTENEFPSVRHSVKRWCRHLGIRAEEIPADGTGCVDRDRLLAAIDDDTALVFVSHVGFTSGELLDDDFLIAVSSKIHRHGGLLAIDGYHATASVPTDVQKIEVDFYFGGLLKEACGSSGNAFLYVRDGRDISPLLSGWFGDADPFEFQSEHTDSTNVRRRFLGGTTAIAPLYHAVEGLRLLLNVGITAIREDSLAKTDVCIQRARSAGIRISSPVLPHQRGALVILENTNAQAISDSLKNHGIFVDSRKGHLLRMAPFVWNTVSEIHQAFDVIEDTIEGPGKTQPRQSTGPVT